MKATPITIITPWYGHFAGGAEVAARAFATQLAGRGFEVQVLTTCCRSPYESWWRNTLAPAVETVDGVIVRRFPANTGGEQRFHQINGRFSSGETFDEADQREFVALTINSDALVEFARERTSGHLVVAMPYTQGVVHAAAAALSGRITLLPCLHDEPQARWTTTTEMMAHSKQFFFLTEEEKTLAIRLFGHRLGRRVVESTVVGVGVELPASVREHLGSRSRADEIRRRYDLPPKFYVYMGRKDVGKNVPRLVHWFDVHRGRGGCGKLLFLGGGDASLVPESTAFGDLGFVPEDDKYAILSEATALINLSENESFSLVVAEAWLCGVPVIVSARSPVTGSHCRKSRGGIPVGNAEELHAALNRLSDGKVRSRMAAAGARYVRRNYAWDHVLDRMLAGAA